MMTNQPDHPVINDNPVGNKTPQKPSPLSGVITVLAAVTLFAAVACAAFAIAYPQRLGAALDALHHMTPLANPALCITADFAPQEDFTDALAALGDAIPTVTCDAVLSDGTAIRLTAMDVTALDEVLRLTDGHMPQNAGECVAVALHPGAAPAIGATVCPYSEETGAPLYAADSGEECMLTVVGCGENTLSVLAAITAQKTDLLLYTASDAAWSSADPAVQLLLKDCTADDPYAAAQALCREYADAQTALLAKQTEERHAALQDTVQQAEAAVLAKEVNVQELDNRLDTANLRVTELENRMMDAVAALQAEQQQFISDMEYNEYYSLRQVDLIPRRDRAEEGYAKQEAVIDALHAELEQAYADRDAIAAEADTAAGALSTLQHAADTALQALDAWSTQPQQTAAAWELTRGEQEPGNAALSAHADAAADMAWLWSAILAAVFFIGSITVYAVSRRADIPLQHTVILALLTAIPAVWYGGDVMTDAVFGHAFPALTGTLPLTGVPFMTLLLLPLSALLSAAAVLLGRRIRKNTAQ